MSEIQTLPLSITKLLWDADLKLIDVQANAGAIIERTLEHGDLESVKDLRQIYSPDQIKNTIKTSRRLSEKVANYYAGLYELNRSEVRGLTAPFIQKQNRFS